MRRVSSAATLETMRNSPWHSLLTHFSRAVGIQSFLPARDTEAPSAARDEDASQIVAPAGGEVEELGRDLTCKGVRAVVHLIGVTLAVPHEACHGVCGADGQGLIKHIDRRGRHVC